VPRASRGGGVEQQLDRRLVAAADLRVARNRRLRLDPHGAVGARVGDRLVDQPPKIVGRAQHRPRRPVAGSERVKRHPALGPGRSVETVPDRQLGHCRRAHTARQVHVQMGLGQSLQRSHATRLDPAACHRTPGTAFVDEEHCGMLFV
jgi:hypothetical protein